MPALIKEAKAENFFGDAFRPRSILRTKPTLQSAGLVLSHSGNDRYRNIRKDHSTHWGCRATTPAVGLTPGRRSNGLPKQSRSALFALPFRFSPAERISVMSNLLTLIFSSITHEWTGNGGWDTTHRTICPKIMLYSGQIESLITKCPDQLRRTVLVHKLHVL